MDSLEWRTESSYLLLCFFKFDIALKIPLDGTRVAQQCLQILREKVFLFSAAMFEIQKWYMM